MSKNKKSKKTQNQAIVQAMRTIAGQVNGQKQNKKKSKKKKKGLPVMGPVATITTAPVAMGNSVRGSAASTVNTRNGCLVKGRDFMFTPIGTGTVSTWVMVGGTPLTPVAFGDSMVRQYLQVYQKYRWRRCVVYYITSSPTSSTGDVMFYYGKNRDSVFLNQTSNFLLPFVLSDPSTVIGPQWTNHVAELQVEGTWKSTDYGMEAAVNNYADGELFLLSKTTTTDSPGYVLFDYEIEFSETQISPRLLALPLARTQYNNLALTSSGAKTAGAIANFNTGSGTTLSGTTSTLPPGFFGDVFKIIFDITNSTFTTGSAGSLISSQMGNGNSQTLLLQDGFTVYAVVDGNQDIILYPNADAAYALAAPMVWQTSNTFAFNIQVWISLVGGINNLGFVPNF
jgi:hypothetical protein